MPGYVRRSFDEEATDSEAAGWHAHRNRWAGLIDTLVLAALIAAIVLAATWVARPQLRMLAAANDANRALVGFWPAEQHGADTFRWSRTDSALRLFGFEQQAPIALRLRLTAVRQPGQSPAVLTLGGVEQLPPVVIQPVVWRRYSFILPAPQRGDEAPLLTLHTAISDFANESR